MAEALCTAYQSYNGTKVRIARIFNTYGPFMDPEDGRVISNFIVQALKDEPITVYGDGSQTRSFCFVDDLIDGWIRLMNSDYDKPVNLGNPDEFNMKDLALQIIKKINSSSDIPYLELPTDDPKKRCPDISLASKLLDWKPKISLSSGLDKTIPWYENLL